MKPVQAKTPYLLPPLEFIAVMRLSAADFQPIELDLNRAEDLASLNEILKRLSGRMPLRKRPR